MTKKNLFQMIALSFCSILTSCAEPKYYGPSYCVKAQYELEDFAKAYAKSHDMELTFIGQVEENSHCLYGVALRDFGTQEIAAARKSALDLVNAIWSKVLSSDIQKNYFTLTRQSCPILYPHPFDRSYVHIKIAYWNSQLKRPLPPFIATTKFFNNTFHYYQADPATQALKLILEESYEDAVLAINS